MHALFLVYVAPLVATLIKGDITVEAPILDHDPSANYRALEFFIRLGQIFYEAGTNNGMTHVWF